MYVEQVFRWPEKDDEVAERVLAGVEVVDGLDVETFGRANVLKDLPISACRSMIIVSKAASVASIQWSHLRALEKRYEEARYVQ